jgi:hypothetical protein
MFKWDALNEIMNGDKAFVAIAVNDVFPTYLRTTPSSRWGSQEF